MLLCTESHPLPPFQPFSAGTEPTNLWIFNINSGNADQLQAFIVSHITTGRNKSLLLLCWDSNMVPGNPFLLSYSILSIILNSCFFLIIINVCLLSAVSLRCLCSSHSSSHFLPINGCVLLSTTTILLSFWETLLFVLFSIVLPNVNSISKLYTYHDVSNFEVNYERLNLSSLSNRIFTHCNTARA